MRYPGYNDLGLAYRAGRKWGFLNRYFPRFAVHLPSNRSLWAVPVIESPSTVPEYSILNEPFGVSRVTVKLILFPVTEPVTGASPRCPFNVPFSVLPSCSRVSVWAMVPRGVSIDTSQLPLTFAGSSAPMTAVLQSSSAQHV